MPASLDARQFWVRAPGQGEITTARLAPRQPDEVQVRTLFTGISRGTESLVFRGEVPPSQAATMRAPFQEGDFPGPVKYGYTSVGRVEDGPADLQDAVVFCLFPHQDVYCVPAAAVTPVPERVPPGRAVLAANMETAVNVVWDAGPSVGDRVVVVGAGVVGLLVAWLCRQIPGTRVTAIDPQPARVGVARELGVECRPAPGRDLVGADLVVHASGNPKGLEAALALAGDEATIVEASWFGTRPVTVPLGEAFHPRRLTIRSSQVGRVSPDREPRWSTRRRLELALSLLDDAVLDHLVTGESAFEALPTAMAALSRDGGDTLCHRIRYDVSAA